jgi:hypothetical protein
MYILPVHTYTHVVDSAAAPGRHIFFHISKYVHIYVCTVHTFIVASFNGRITAKRLPRIGVEMSAIRRRELDLVGFNFGRYPFSMRRWQSR